MTKCKSIQHAYLADGGRLEAAEQEAQMTAADHEDHPSRVKSLPVKGSLMPKVTLTFSCKVQPNLVTY